MKQITILWMERMEARIITATPSEIAKDVHVSSEEPELPSEGVTPDYRRQRKDARKNYFERIVEAINTTHEIVIFGSDSSKEEFLDFLHKNNEDLYNRVIGVEAAGDMPEEKIIARGRKYI